MARLQILQLPEGAGDDRPPFILVIDQYQPLRYVMAPGMDEQVVDEFEGLAEEIGARGVLVFRETVEIPANEPQIFEGPVCADVPGCDGDCCSARNIEKELKAASEVIKRLTADREEARNWARHGYEIGQKHCGWTDHGVAPEWLTEGWPPHIDSCEYLQQMAEFDEAIARVRAMSTRPEIMNAEQERPDIWLHGYECGVLAAKSTLRPRDEETSKP
jgi:hypothetical protein